MTTAVPAPRRLETVLTVVGMAGFWSFFNSTIYPAAVFGTFENTAMAFSIVASLALALGGIALGVLGRLRPLGNRALSRLMALSGAACLGGLLCAVIAPAAVLAFAALLGLFVAVLGLGWARANEFSFRQGCDVTTPLTFSMLACSAVMVGLSVAFPLTASNQSVAVYAFLALSCMSCAFVLRSQEVPDAKPVEPGIKGAGHTRALVMFVTLGLYLVGSGILRGIYTASDSPAGITGSLLHAGLLVLFLVAAASWSRWEARRGHLNRLPWVAFVLVCVVALYVAVLFSGTLDYVSNELLLPTRPMAMLFVWGGVLSFAHEARRPSVCAVGCIALPLFGLGRIAVYVTWFLLQGGDMTIQLNATVLGTAFLLTVGVVAYFALPQGAGSGGCVEGGSVSGASPVASPFADSISELVTRYALSEREAQVFELLVAGNSRAKIAELLVLSVNSVQTYAKSLYRKMDVHSRQELIDLVHENGR